MRKKIKIDLIKVKKHKNPKKKCLSCDCDESEHDKYWYCIQVKGLICNVCCWYDSLAPDWKWGWEECKNCEHNKEEEY